MTEKLHAQIYIYIQYVRVAIQPTPLILLYIRK